MATTLKQLQNQLKAAARESPLLIFEAYSRKDGSKFREVSNRRRFNDLKTMLSQNYQLTILANDLTVTETVVRWAVAEAKLHDQPEDSKNQANFKTMTNAVLKENQIAINQ